MMIRNSMELTISCADEDVCEIMKRSQEVFATDLERCDFDKDYIPVDVLQQPYYVEEPHPDYPTRALNLPFMRKRQGNLLRFLQYKASNLADPITGLAYGVLDSELDNDSSPYVWLSYFVLYSELFEGGEGDGCLDFYGGSSDHHHFKWAPPKDRSYQYRGDALTSAERSFTIWRNTDPSSYSQSFENFLGSYFSLGNYMICPHGCNDSRSEFGTTDTVDHYLFHMRKHFSCDTKENNGNSEILHGLFSIKKKGETYDGSDNFIEMLKKFRLDGQQGIEDFDDFVKRFYFQDLCEHMGSWLRCKSWCKP